MKIIEENKSLKDLNTFGVGAKAKYFARVESIKQLQKLLRSDLAQENKKFVLGGGSNILFVNDYDGLVIFIAIKGKKVIKEIKDKVWIKISCGEDWDGFVRWAVGKNYGGVENMVMVPGTVGGAISQNIAVYGQNISEVVNSVEAIDTKTGELLTLCQEECEYEYRSSLFKRDPGRYIVVRATLVLEKNPDSFELNYHERKDRYGSIVESLEKTSEPPYTVEDVMNAAIYMRTRRLPSVDEYGTCGSFFQNPIVSVDKYEELSKKIPELQSYPVKDLSYEIKDWERLDGMDYVKIPAGRILDFMGYLDYWEGDVGVSPTHALCLVTNKKATGQEIHDFAKKIEDRVKKEYGIQLQREVVTII